MLKRPSALVATVALLVAAGLARADDITNAEELFRRAKALMSANKHAEACPLLEESYRLERAMGTLLNVALCHEKIGKIATAWGEFRAVEQQARAAAPPREDRAKLAREHADRLESRLSRVRIVVGPAARAPGLVIKVDGEEKGEALWGGSGMTVDPGTHHVQASAPDKKTADVAVNVEKEGTVQVVELRPLDDLPRAAPLPVSGGPSELQDDAYASNRARRTTGFVIGGIGVVSLAAGAAFGVAAIVNDGDARDCSPCVAGSEAARASNDATDRALLFANIANVAVPVGLLGAALGTYLVLTAGPTAKVAIVPHASPGAGAAGFDVRATW